MKTYDQTPNDTLIPVQEIATITAEGYKTTLDQLTSKPLDEWFEFDLPLKKRIWLAACSLDRPEILLHLFEKLARKNIIDPNIIELRSLVNAERRKALFDAYTHDAKGLISPNFIWHFTVTSARWCLREDDTWEDVLEDTLRVNHTNTQASVLAVFLNEYQMAQNKNLKHREPESQLSEELLIHERGKRVLDMLGRYGFSIEKAQNGVYPTGDKDGEKITIKHPTTCHFVLYQMTGDQPKMDHKTLDLLIDCGADWRRVWEDNSLDPQSRHSLSQNPIVRKALLQEVVVAQDKPNQASKIKM